VEEARAAGTDVESTLDAPAAPPPPSLQLTVVRIVQEALTNARRHAPGAPVRVRVQGSGPALCIEVRNGPAPSGTRAGGQPGGGHGLLGMQERAHVHGGWLEATATADGFVVRASLPLLPSPVLP
jgi:signal transduction histidine kinase